ncbi:hypothetical protein HDU83_004244 [Entophlyctis luteolus]|nr:hypothetical protein HDU83_004244 [Entophlyctis luteolus]
MNLLLIAVGGCAATNIRLVLEKKRIPVTRIDVNVKGQRRAAVSTLMESTEPWETVEIGFDVGVGGNVAAHEETVRRVVEASVERYCGVHKTLEHGIPRMTWSARVGA